MNQLPREDQAVCHAQFQHLVLSERLTRRLLQAANHEIGQGAALQVCGAFDDSLEIEENSVVPDVQSSAF